MVGKRDDDSRGPNGPSRTRSPPIWSRNAAGAADDFERLDARPDDGDDGAVVGAAHTASGGHNFVVLARHLNIPEDELLLSEGDPG